jgi:hypothetical protein
MRECAWCHQTLTPKRGESSSCWDQRRFCGRDCIFACLRGKPHTAPWEHQPNRVKPRKEAVTPFQLGAMLARVDRALWSEVERGYRAAQGVQHTEGVTL